MYFFAVVLIHRLIIRFFFFFNDTATTEIYTLSLHDALPIYEALHFTGLSVEIIANMGAYLSNFAPEIDRKSTRLNSSHGYISYAVFCLKKKKILRAAGGQPDRHTALLMDDSNSSTSIS